jgi:hypothetical protein
MVAMESVVLSCRSGRKNSFWSRKGNIKRMGHTSSHAHPAALHSPAVGTASKVRSIVLLFSIVEDSNALRIRVLVNTMSRPGKFT